MVLFGIATRQLHHSQRHRYSSYPLSHQPQIRSVAPLATLEAPRLRELYVAANKVRGITALTALTALTTLELGSNRISEVEGLEGQALLQELWLGRNRIAAIKNLDHLTNLRRISLQSNRWVGPPPCTPRLTAAAVAGVVCWRRLLCNAFGTHCI